MQDKSVGIFTTHNEPSTLTDEEKRLRAKRRSLTKGMKDAMNRLAKLGSALETTPDPAQRATIEAQTTLARKRVEKFQAGLDGLTSGVVN